MPEAARAAGAEPRRVVVASPRTRAARSLPVRADEPYTGPYSGAAGVSGRSGPSERSGPSGLDHDWNIAADLDEQTELGAVYVRTLVRAQLRTAFGTGGIVLAVVAALPLLELASGPARGRMLGLPLPWLLLAAGIQPLWILAARRQARLAESAEHDFVRLVSRP
ncbi:hypothetical protein [Actinomadura rupiterrae]|uniref:hypothetical protein n=1 Tax=Actinomadura rupiterrae TaxID=559627 RepID=UPI0020A5C376|nr:hypothetical protein [Actinomadura rupiterrae]MCP2338435.1 hypothetical protein [Actinomadura rupiterrae]